MNLILHSSLYHSLTSRTPHAHHPLRYSSLAVINESIIDGCAQSVKESGCAVITCCGAVMLRY